METPKSVGKQIRTMRTHTPRLSERKKKLFGTAKDNEVSDEEEELLNGIQPLVSNKSRNGNKTPNSLKIIESSMGSHKRSPRVMSFFETESEDEDSGEEEKPSPSRRSARLGLKKSREYSKLETETTTTSHKENIPITTPTRKEAQEAQKLQKMFSKSMQITPRDKSSVAIEETSSEDEDMTAKIILEPIKCVSKRHIDIEFSTGLSPVRKMSKITSPIDNVSISTKSFYPVKTKILQKNLPGRPSCRNLFGQNLSCSSTVLLKPRQSSRRGPCSKSTSINRGVSHKVRKRTNNLSIVHKHYAPVDIDQILNNVRNEKLRKLIIAQREEKQQIEKIHSIFRKAPNPIAMARPLSTFSNHEDSNNNLAKNEQPFEHSESIHQGETDFSDIECDAEVEKKDFMAMNEEVIPLITHQDNNASSIKTDDSSAAPVKKKFFKSGRSTTTRKEVHLTDNIKATLTANGKLAIVPPEKKKVRKCIKIRDSISNEFSDEQATVDAILRNLDDTTFGDVTPPKNERAGVIQNKSDNNNTFLDEIDYQLSLMHEESPNFIEDIIPQDIQDFNEFRKRLPFNTTDPEIIERQHLLLDFLITNNICTEENFKIFIEDPDNHKAEAEKIIDELVIVVTDHQNTDFRQRIPYNTTDPGVIEQQHHFLDFLLQNNICTEENFDIFIANYSQRKVEATAILSQYISSLNGQFTDNSSEIINNYVANNLLSQETMTLSANKAISSFENLNNNNVTLSKQMLQTTVTTNDAMNVPPNTSTLNSISLETQKISAEPQKLFPVFYPGGCQPLPQLFTRRRQLQRSWNAGYGSTQYQIDAGQKEFGVHQCKQCGLVYTVHEPEEEKLHRDFHASLHILRFKGWIDEDIVAIYPEWGPDGRVLRISESSPQKRIERLMNILKIVDKELGSSSYILPKVFVAYFAVRKLQIVGLCLVQPLDKANKYMCINGLDCCTEEQFEAKCGISRIWVSPLHRRFHIGSKLIQAVQLNTIFGEELPLNKIAFSAPTELGKAFAQKISKTENFLVYQ